MRIDDQEGLRVAVVDPDEALNRRWAAQPPPVDLVRVSRPDPQLWPSLEEAGFVVKPAWVNWRAQLRPTEAEFLAALPGSERRNIRLGQRFVAEHDISVVVQEGISSGTLTAFLALYDDQIARMRNGVGYARRVEKQLRLQSADYLAVYAYQGTTMVGACLCRVRESQSMLQLRFAAAAPMERHGRVQRAVYLAAFQAARERGLTVMSLGNDPSLYGHIVSTGLFRFKSRLGFTPAPARMVDPKFGGDEADLVLRLTTLSDPSLLLGYATPDPEGPLRAVVLSGAADTDIRPYRTAALAGIVTQTVEATAHKSHSDVRC